MTKLVTICIPTFNSSGTIASTLNSLLNQTYQNLIIVVFDNCSTDNTLEIVESFDGKFSSLTILTSVENIGAEGNFTKCLRYSKGDYTAIFHADDIYHETIVSRQVEVMERDESLLAVATHANEINANGKIIGTRFVPNELKKSNLTILNFEQLFRLTLKYGNILTCPSVMARTDIYSKEIKTWNGRDFKSSADLDVWLRVSQMGNIGFLSDPLLSYRVADASTSFRMKQTRVTRHDIFLVLDHYFKGNSDSELLSFYKFLELKDVALRVYNNSGERLIPGGMRHLRVALSSNWHMKFYLKIWAIWLLQKLKILR